MSNRSKLAIEAKKRFMLAPPERVINEWKDIISSGQKISPGQELDLLIEAGSKVFTKEVAKKHPSAVINFVYHLREYSLNLFDQYKSDTTFKDASALESIELIRKNVIFPVADPYFKIDPEHTIKTNLIWGISQGFFNWRDVQKALRQDKNCEGYQKSRAAALEIYRVDHTRFGKDNPGVKDYGFHLFIGRKKDSNWDGFVDYDGSFESRASTMDKLTDYLWEAVRKGRKVLLTKSPGRDFLTLSPNEMIELYTKYYSRSKRLEFSDPFLGQPK